MQQEQVVKVHGTRFGSGYLIAPRLVLTAAHLVAPDGALAISIPGSAGRFAAVVRAHGGDTLDAALVEITAGDWAPPSTLRGHLSRRPQRWGRCVTGGIPVPVAAMGFPRQQRTDDSRGAEELQGHLRPHGRPPHEILDPHSPYGRPEDSSTPWSGMSGAAAFPQGDDLLLGVVKADRQPRHGTRLTAARAEDLLARDDFRAVIREAAGGDPRLEPVELADLLKQAPPMDVHSLTMLLRADTEVVPFHGRADVLDVLESWCRTPGPPSVRVLTGPGGQGKTRLARQLMTRLRDDGWVTGEVRGEPGDLRVLRAVQHPLLLVVDYAESRPELVKRLRDQTERAAHPVRLLLLARSLGSWKTKATGHLREIPLHALSPDATDRDRAFRLAAEGFARRLADGVGRPDVDWLGLAATLPVTRPGPGTETALTVQMAALVALLRQAHDRGEGPLEAELLDVHESNYWTDSVKGRRVRDMDPGLLTEAVATAVLCPASSKDEAVATIARLMPREPLVEEVAAWLRDLYPPPENRYWGQLEPDRLGEYLAAEKVIEDPGLLTRLFADAPDHQRVQTLTVLARAAVAHANEERADEAHQVVDQLRAVLRETPARAPLTAGMLRAHSDALPAHSHVLRDYALDVARELSRLCRDLGDDVAALRDRAWALHNLAERHLAVGDWADAVAAAGEAAALRERLAADGATTSRTEWADSLLVLSRSLRRTGGMPEAHRTGDQALGLFRALAAAGGDDQEKRERGLVRALLNQSQVVWRLDPATIRFNQIARSDEYTDEALRRARDLMSRDADLDPLLLTDALSQRSESLWRLKRPPEALAPSEEALRTARQLMSENPDSYAFDLADALMGHAVHYNAAAQPRSEAIAMELESIELLRPLARDLPEARGGTLAQTLYNLALDLCDERDYPAATDAIEEAIELRRAAARNSPGLGMPELANAVSALGYVHASEDDHRAAVECYKESLETYARATVPLSASQLGDQAGTAFSLALSYEFLGRTADALAAANQSGAIRRRLSEYGPSLYTAGYATALGNLSGLYRRQGRRIEERIVLRHALSLHRRLARDSEEEREGLANCLADLGASYGVSAFTADRGYAALTEAYELYVELPDKGPIQLDNLAFTCQELGRVLLRTSRFPEAVRFAEQEVALRRRLSVTDPDGNQERFVYFALLRLAKSLTMAGRPAAAWRTAIEAEGRCHALVDRPGRTPAGVALLLTSLATTVSLCGRHDARRIARAVGPARRAARIYRRLVDRNPHEHQDNLRSAVNTLASVLTRLGRHAEAAQAQLTIGA